eukprot:1157673-Pelagomonas_calceolata.AAC.5
MRQLTAARMGASCGPIGELRRISCWFRMPVDSGIPASVFGRSKLAGCEGHDKMGSKECGEVCPYVQTHHALIVDHMAELAASLQAVRKQG